MPAPATKMVSIVLSASSRGAEDTVATHGNRHLLEHVVAAAGDGKLDRALEQVGGLLLASTYRDATVFEVIVPPDRISAGLDAIAELLRPPRFSEQAMAGEIAAVQQELALTDRQTSLVNRLWVESYSDIGLDPAGNSLTVAKATRRALTDLYDRQYRAANLALTMSGPIEMDKELGMLSTLMNRVPGDGRAAPYMPREVGKLSIAIEGEFGGIGVPIGGLREPGSCAVLALSLFLVSNAERAFLSYTPSSRNSLISIGVRTSPLEWFRFIRSLPESTITASFERARALCRVWAERQLKTYGAARLQALLLSQSPDEDVSKFEPTIDAMTMQEYLDAWQKLRGALPK